MSKSSHPKKKYKNQLRKKLKKKKTYPFPALFQSGNSGVLQSHNDLQGGIEVVDVVTGLAHLDKVTNDALAFFQVWSGYDFG